MTNRLVNASWVAIKMDSFSTTHLFSRPRHVKALLANGCLFVDTTRGEYKKLRRFFKLAPSSRLKMAAAIFDLAQSASPDARHEFFVSSSAKYLSQAVPFGNPLRTKIDDLRFRAIVDEVSKRAARKKVVSLPTDFDATAGEVVFTGTDEGPVEVVPVPRKAGAPDIHLV